MNEGKQAAPHKELINMNEGKQAAPHKELIKQLMDSRVPKTEREHAALREIEMLREALRLPAALAAPKPDYERGFVDGMQEQMKRSVDRAVRAMSAKPMTKQEWMAFLEKAVGEFDWEAAGRKREWQGLTDEEVEHIADSEWEEAFVRLVEAKLKEKNGG